MPYWDARGELIAADYLDVVAGKHHIDILAARLIQQRAQFGVIVASNLMGEILSDLGSASVGPISLAPSASINPERAYPSMFEPVHGSAPDIAGRGIANPVGMIWSGAMMLDHLGEASAAAAVVRALETVLNFGPRTRDLGGTATTQQMGLAIEGALSI